MDRGQRDQEDDVVERFHVDDVPDAELHVREKLAHWLYSHRWSGCGGATSRTGARISRSGRADGWWVVSSLPRERACTCPPQALAHPDLGVQRCSSRYWSSRRWSARRSSPTR